MAELGNGPDDNHCEELDDSSLEDRIKQVYNPQPPYPPECDWR